MAKALEVEVEVHWGGWMQRAVHGGYGRVGATPEQVQEQVTGHHGTENLTQLAGSEDPGGWMARAMRNHLQEQWDP